MSLSLLRKDVRKLGVAYVSSLTEKELISFLDTSEFSLGWRWNYIFRVLETEQDIHMATDCLTSPVRNLKKLKKESIIFDFLEHHPVIITLTTSPLRLPKITAVLATIDLTYVTKINVCLPYEYGGKKEKYNLIPQELIDFPKVNILRIEKDFGPITKMLPTIESESDKKSLIISIDDDVAYPLGMVNELIYQKLINYPNAVLTMGKSMPFFSSIKNMSKYWPEKRQRRPLVDLVEGWSSVLYSPNTTNTDCMKQLSTLSKTCFLSDDFVISYALAYAKIPRVIINNNYISNPYPFSYGTGEDALHAGAGLDGGKRKYIKNDDAINYEKYGDCLEKIRQYVDSIRNNQEQDVCEFRRSRSKRRFSRKTSALGKKRRSRSV